MVPYTGTSNRSGDPFVLSSTHDSNDYYPLQVKRTPKNRVVWDKKLQNRFLLAIKNLDPSNKLVPSAILKEMKVPGLTRENISSHLQKYRKNQHKNHMKMGDSIEDDFVLGKNNTNHNTSPQSDHSPPMDICASLKNPIIETTFIVSHTQNFTNLQNRLNHLNTTNLNENNNNFNLSTTIHSNSKIKNVIQEQPQPVHHQQNHQLNAAQFQINQQPIQFQFNNNLNVPNTCSHTCFPGPSGLEFLMFPHTHSVDSEKLGLCSSVCGSYSSRFPSSFAM